MKPNHLFWKFIYHLVIKEDLRIIDISPDNKQVWIEKEQNGKKAAIRIVKVEYDWMKDLEIDKEKAKRMLNKVKKIIPARKLTFFNIYVSTYPPVDLNSRLTQHWENEKDMKSFFIASDSAQSTVDQPGDVLKTMGFEQHWEDSRDLMEEEHQYYARYFKKEVFRKQEKLEKKDKNLLLFGKPRFTYLLLVSILLVFFAVEQAGGSTDILTLIDFGAKYNPAIIEGEWWRFFSAMFLHIGFFHLFMNSLALFYLGGAVERMYGTVRFVIIYFIAGLFGSLASFAFNEQISAGASGAIFGCFGALLYFGFIHQKLFFRTMGMNVLIILAINLSFGFIVPAVDNGAHIGGLIGGFLASAFVHLPKHGWKFRQIFIFFLTAVLSGTLFWYGHANESKAESPLLDLQIAQEHLERDNVEEAEYILKSLLENKDNAQAYFLMGNVSVQKEDYETSAQYFEKAAELENEFPQAYYNLSLVYIELNEYEKAELALARAKETNESENDEKLNFEKVEELLNEKE
ncbi:rhomboid family intramembrane serine protease [Alteribacillus sp. YIM 98480]|uniref:rhomboid family protein n=1 Tax=Alteribacillus sp. YIM 98480 TaxID=2606599 RepID=UPI00131B78FC|nr:rhomboid family intramembrane serine protease [Alteribacillus sp. YIM 98480]